MQIKNQKDFWSGLMFVGVGVAFAVGSLDYSFGNSARPGPGYFPFGLGVLSKFLEPQIGAVLGKILILALIILFIQKRPQGLFALKGRVID